MADAIGMFTAPIWRVIALVSTALLLIVGTGSGFAIRHLYSTNTGLQSELATCKAEITAARQAARSAQDAITVAEEQCKGLIEYERGKAKIQVNPDVQVDDDYLGRVFGGMRDRGKGSGATDAPGSRDNPKTPGPPGR